MKNIKFLSKLCFLSFFIGFNALHASEANSSAGNSPVLARLVRQNSQLFSDERNTDLVGNSLDLQGFSGEFLQLFLDQSTKFRIRIPLLAIDTRDSVTPDFQLDSGLVTPGIIEVVRLPSPFELDSGHDLALAVSRFGTPVDNPLVASIAE